MLFLIYNFSCSVGVVLFSFHLAKFASDSWCLLWPGADGKLHKWGYLCSDINQLTAQLKSILLSKTWVREILTLYMMNCFEKTKIVVHVQLWPVLSEQFCVLWLCCNFMQVSDHMKHYIWLMIYHLPPYDAMCGKTYFQSGDSVWVMAVPCNYTTWYYYYHLKNYSYADHITNEPNIM